MLIATLMVRDEADIIASNLEHHIAHGVDAFIVTDHLSVDGTADIVQSYPQVVKYIYEDNPGYYQGQYVTRMAHLAAEMGADWIVHLDADEFWRGFQILDNVPKGVSVVYSGTNLNPALSDGSTCRDFLPYDFYDKESFSFDLYPYFRLSKYKPMKGVKIAHRPSSSCVIAQGNHDIDNIAGERGFTTCLQMDHYPVRSYSHFVRKVKNGGESYTKTQGLSPNVGHHWKAWYQDMQFLQLRNSYLKQALCKKEEQDLLERKLIFPREHLPMSGLCSWLKVY